MRKSFINPIKRPSLILLFILSILPAFILGSLILTNAVNVPLRDEWAVANIIIKSFQNRLSFSDLLAQHNESRYLFPRLIFITLAYFTNWDIRYEMLTIFLVACIVSFNTYQLTKLTVNEKPIKTLIIFSLVNMLIFAPIQYENWLWGIQLIVFMPIVCITTCLVIAHSNISIKYKFLIGAILCTISSFSYANGILIWFIVFPVLATSEFGKSISFNKHKWLVIGWITGFILNAVVYFYNYQKPSHHPSFLQAMFYPEKAMNYLLSFLGAPLGIGIFQISNDITTVMTAIKLLGLLLLLIFITAWIYYLKFFVPQMLVWLSIGTYSVISALITTLGRVGFGVEQSLSSRYTTFSIYLTVAIVNLIPIVINDALARGILLRNKRIILRIFTLLLLGNFIFLHWQTSVYAAARMSEWKRDSLQGKGCLLFINIVLEKECIAKNINPHIDRVKERANVINRLGLFEPKLVSSNKIAEIQGSAGKITFDRYGYGWFDNVTKVGKKAYQASGWARLPDRGETADIVILTYQNPNNDDIIFALSDIRNPRQDVAKITQDDRYLMSGWQKSFSASRLPKGDVKINAWAFDTNTGKAFQLNGTHIIENP